MPKAQDRPRGGKRERMPELGDGDLRSAPRRRCYPVVMEDSLESGTSPLRVGVVARQPPAPAKLPRQTAVRRHRPAGAIGAAYCRLSATSQAKDSSDRPAPMSPGCATRRGTRAGILVEVSNKDRETDLPQSGSRRSARAMTQGLQYAYGGNTRLLSRGLAPGRLDRGRRVLVHGARRRVSRRTKNSTQDYVPQNQAPCHCSA